MKNYKDIPSYIAEQRPKVQASLKKLRATIKKAAPKAEEKIGYGIPTFTFHGNLVHFGAFKTHIGFFPAPSTIAAFKEELKKYKTSKGTVQLPLEEPLPVGLITRIVKFRVKENTAKTKTRHSKR